jgi:N-methylhydantoinase A/oxoprolinase/acetone carboxylase beta subunit
LRLEDQTDVKELYRDFRSHLMNLSFGVDLPEAPVRIETFALQGSIPTGDGIQGSHKSTNDKKRKQRPIPPGAERGVIWDSSLSRVKTPVFPVGELSEGDLIEGPAIGEARDTTYVIPPGWELSVLQGSVGELRTKT